MALIRLMLTVTLLTLTSGALAGGIEIREFDDPVTEQRYHDLTASMRCPLCENQAIDDSDAPISADMRERVYQLLQDGQSDIEIVNHMVQRFGEYILYNPRLENRTYLLWGLPIGLVLLGVVVVVMMVRARRNASAKALSAEERARLDALINRERSS
ncbi:MAG: cytochrome c-type biogenesis protein [Vreelandella alkaliphila]|uniref:Cytochrome c-type biogenesis protein n=1 Tax=Halomonas campaniensis TaxID=213554 RepID=A0A3D0KGV3_9GAMM|nr:MULTISPECIES: cytochrome c-type biogenesis protein [unclassified Halomonas]HBP42906.1 cytochrome c-type biogenesis protein CcmH [Halomonas sp.]HCA02520.1 cytochrome c-type biogenesis protein CcmH [Halomonas campaniensis]